MTLEVCCKSCYKTIRFQNSAKDRGALKIKEGEELGISCSSCGKKHKYHLNKITAIPNPILAFIAVIITIIATVLIVLKISPILANPMNNSFYHYELATSFFIPIIVYSVFIEVLRAKCRNFNSYRI